MSAVSLAELPRLFALLLVAATCQHPRPAVERATTAPKTATTRPAAQTRRVEQRRLEADVRALAVPREPGSAGWKQVQTIALERLAQAGFELERHEYGSGTNLIATAAGDSPERVLVSAHYDHIESCAGADDNASGVAALLELARVLGSERRARTLVLALWDEEERGLFGSRAYAERARARNEPLALAISLDSIGFASDAPNSQSVPAELARLFPKPAEWLKNRGNRADFLALVASTSASAGALVFSEQAAARGLPLLRIDLAPLQALLAPDLFRSDHASFWFFGYPALLISDTAEFRNPSYHCSARADTPETLNYSFLAAVTDVVTAATAELLERPSTLRTGSNEQR